MSRPKSQLLNQNLRGAHCTPSLRASGTLGAHIGINIMFCTETCFDK